jgi:hypothetical protein
MDSKLVEGCHMAEPIPPTEDIVLAHFIVSDDVERFRRSYAEVLDRDDAEILKFLRSASAGREGQILS